MVVFLSSVSKTTSSPCFTMNSVREMLIVAFFYFTGIYTHDLIYNAQKPAYIRPSDPVPATTPKTFAEAAALAKMNSEAAADLNSKSSFKTATNSVMPDKIQTGAHSPTAGNKAALKPKDGISVGLGSGAAHGEPLVNFERHRTAATIVKSLLRLLHASSKYDFKPIPEVVSRCLWMAALPDEEITARSRSLV